MALTVHYVSVLGATRVCPPIEDCSGKVDKLKKERMIEFVFRLEKRLTL